MTPEDLESVPGIDGYAVGKIQQAINGYYGQDYAPTEPEDGSEAGVEVDSANDEPADVAEAVEAQSEAMPETSDTMVESAE